jgi:aminopeptidase N
MYDDGYSQSSHPVSAEVLTPSEINTLFDSITYDKGSSLLRMLESTVTDENFQTGLNVSSCIN